MSTDDRKQKIILEEVRKGNKLTDGVERAVNVIGKDMGDDRKKIDDTIIGLEEVRRQLKQAREDIDNLNKTMTDAVHKAVAEATQPLLDSMERFEKNKTLHVKEIRHVWWPFFRKKVS